MAVNKILRDKFIVEQEYNEFHKQKRSLEQLFRQIDAVHHSFSSHLSEPTVNKHHRRHIIPYKICRDDEKPLYGVIEPMVPPGSQLAVWTLVHFTTMTEKKAEVNEKKDCTKTKAEEKSNKMVPKRKQNKKKKTKVISAERSYDAKPCESVYITRKMTEDLIPIRLEIDIDPNMCFESLCKGIALQNKVIRSRYWVHNFDFVDPKTKETLYCLSDEISPDEKYRGCKYKLRDGLYTEQKIIELTGVTKEELPVTIRNKAYFQSKLKLVAEIEKMMNDKEVRDNLFHVSVSWHTVPVFIDNNKVNKTQHKMNKTKKIWLHDCKAIADNMENIQLIPLLLFNHKKKEYEDGYIDIDAGWRLCIEGGDVLITLKYMKQKGSKPYLLPTGIHLDRDRIAFMHYLVGCASFDSGYFRDWQSKFNDLSIGNHKDEVNRYKAKVKECEQYKKQLMDKTEQDEEKGNFIRGLLNYLKQSHQNMDSQLINFVQKGQRLTNMNVDIPTYSNNNRTTPPAIYMANGYNIMIPSQTDIVDHTLIYPQFTTLPMASSFEAIQFQAPSVSNAVNIIPNTNISAQLSVLNDQTASFAPAVLLSTFART